MCYYISCFKTQRSITGVGPSPKAKLRFILILKLRTLKCVLISIYIEFVAKKLNFNPRNQQELQEIKKYPQAIALLEETNNQYQKIDDLGFQQMPADAYEKWLGSLKQTKNKQDDETFKKQFKGIIIKKTKG